MTIIYALIIFAILILVHEFGHFITAKFFGVKVKEFALGMGPVLLKKEKGETIYSLRAIPIGGFCSMEGEDEDSEDQRAFNKKPSWQRGIILFAGSFMNLILAIVIMAGILISIGYPSTTIQTVQDGSPAQLAGLLPGDKIISIEDNEVRKWENIIEFVGETKAGDTLKIEIKRANKLLSLETATKAGEDGRTVIGISPSLDKKPLTALKDGTISSFQMIGSMLDILKQLFTGDVPAKELTGPVGIVYLVGDSAKLGMSYVAYLAALISLNLAIINLLPFPALDGGRLIFLVIRKLTGKVITDEIEAKVHIIGIMLLFALMIFVTWQDIIRYILPA